MTLQDRLEELWKDYQLEHTYNTKEAQEANHKRSTSIALASIKKDIDSVVPKSYKAKVGLDVAQLWDSQDATDGYNQALKDVRERLERYIGNE